MMEKHIVVKPKNNEQVNICLRVTKNTTENITIEHSESNTTSNVHIKAVVFPDAMYTVRAVIRIAKNLHAISAFLKISVLLVDDTARAEVQPNLEILSNDLQCSHASSITTIDEKQLEYLMSRGLSKEDATDQIVRGFLNENATSA